MIDMFNMVDYLVDSAENGKWKHHQQCAFWGVMFPLLGVHL